MTITARQYVAIDPFDDEKLAERMEQSGKYRVLRQLPDLPTAIIPDDGNVRRGLYVDVESTGLDTGKDQVTELACIPFRFTKNGLQIEASPAVRWYNEPSIPISDEAAEVTGITMETVRDHKIDIQHFEALIDASDIVIAHNAGFDRKMLERVSSKLKVKCWGCSQTQVGWPRGSNRLEWLLYKMGHFYEAHGAVADCHAGLHAITQPLGMPRDPTEAEQAMAAGVDWETGLSQILAASRKTTHHVWALRAAFDAKDVLKARGYFWNGGEDGRAKSWHKEVEDVDAEREWLAAKVYRQLTSSIPARFDKVTAFDRFSVRA